MSEVIAKIAIIKPHGIDDYDAILQMCTLRRVYYWFGSTRMLNYEDSYLLKNLAAILTPGQMKSLLCSWEDLFRAQNRKVLVKRLNKFIKMV